jgi:hypothetical protein
MMKLIKDVIVSKISILYFDGLNKVIDQFTKDSKGNVIKYKSRKKEHSKYFKFKK